MVFTETIRQREQFVTAPVWELTLNVEYLKNSWLFLRFVLSWLPSGKNHSSRIKVPITCYAIENAIRSVFENNAFEMTIHVLHGSM